MFLEEKVSPKPIPANTEPSKKGFIAWLERQPAETSYCYTSNDSCAFAQYLHANGFPHASCGGTYWHQRGEYHELPFDADILVIEPWTFGALAERLRAL